MELTLTTTQTTVRELAAQGFSGEEIEHLKLIKASHDPFREFCETNREFERLAFLKWRYEQGAFVHT